MTMGQTRAVPIPPFADYADTEYGQSLKQPIPIIKPITKPIIRPIICEIHLVKLFVSET